MKLVICGIVTLLVCDYARLKWDEHRYGGREEHSERRGSKSSNHEFRGIINNSITSTPTLSAIDVTKDQAKREKYDSLYSGLMEHKKDKGLEAACVYANYARSKLSYLDQTNNWQLDAT